MLKTKKRIILPNHKDKAILVLLCLLIIFFYEATVIKSPEKVTFEYKEMVYLNNPEAELKLKMPPSGRYMLKIKHQIQDGQVKNVFFNGQQIPAIKTKKKRVIQTDYFYLDSVVVNREENMLRVKFSGVFPPDIDIRLYNYLPTSIDELEGDFFIFFKAVGPKRQFKGAEIILIFLFSFGILFLLHLYLRKKQKNPISGIIRGAKIFTSFLIILVVNNYLPLSIGPYSILVSQFFFSALFFISFLVGLI